MIPQRRTDHAVLVRRRTHPRSSHVRHFCPRRLGRQKSATRPTVLRVSTGLWLWPAPSLIVAGLFHQRAAQPPCPNLARFSSPAPCPTPTVRSTSAICWSTSRP